jgi:hypothetical protein
LRSDQTLGINEPVVSAAALCDGVVDQANKGISCLLDLIGPVINV